MLKLVWLITDSRIVCISDTHAMTSHIRKKLPDGDILIHAGDFTRCGHLAEVREFNEWLNSQPHKHKIVIAGNHELSFDQSFHCKQVPFLEL
jgi:3',5'-cyclic AMP phosphodiesterase CpdA